MKTLNKIWKEQKRFNNYFYKNIHKNPEQNTKEIILHLISECDELLREINWKLHRKRDTQIIRSNLIEEWIDIYKYWLTIGMFWGFTPQEFIDEFWRKSAVCQQRYQQEIELDIKNKKVCAIDIDGVLADYPKSFLDFAVENFGVSWQLESVPECFNKPSLLHSKIKDKYRQSGTKQNIKVISGAQELLNTLKKKGFSIILLTARPYKKYKRIFADTLIWLNKNKLKYDAIIWDENKNERVIKEFPHLKFMIEDSYQQALRVANLGYKVFLLKGLLSKNSKPHKNIIEINSLKEIKNHKEVLK